MEMIQKNDKEKYFDKFLDLLDFEEHKQSYETLIIEEIDKWNKVTFKNRWGVDDVEQYVLKVIEHQQGTVDGKSKKSVKLTLSLEQFKAAFKSLETKCIEIKKKCDENKEKVRKVQNVP